MTFVTGMAEGDIVLAADGATVLGVGRIAGDYSFDAASDFPHRRPVEWLSLDEWRMPDPEGLRTTVHEVKKAANILEAERKVHGTVGHSPLMAREPITRRETDIRSLRPQPPRLVGVPGRIQSVLDRKGQCILYGPPGTGKTFWAEKAALDLAAYGAFGQPFESLAENERVQVVGSDRGDGLVRLCCFHPAYGYEDFIEGYRPETANGQVVFRLRDGVFKRLCKEAQQAPDRKFFLIVDEINRGDIPRIFGEWY